MDECECIPAGRRAMVFAGGPPPPLPSSLVGSVFCRGANLCNLPRSSSPSYVYRCSSLGRSEEEEESGSPFKSRTVSVFWDLDNKPPVASPYEAAMNLRDAASRFGTVVDIVAYANRNAFLHIPEWVRRERRDRKELDVLEQKGMVEVADPYVCGMCGRKCRTNVALRKHFKELHEREQKKRIARLESLRGNSKKRKAGKLRAKWERYKEAARTILVPKVGFGLEADLRRAGVFVRTVKSKPQAADVALQRRMAESMNSGVRCLCLVSDDTDFAGVLARARSLDLTTLVFGDSPSLRPHAHFWFPWLHISQGLTPRRHLDDAAHRLSSCSSSHYITPPSSSTFGQQMLIRDVHHQYRDDDDVQHKLYYHGAPPPLTITRSSAFEEEEEETVIVEEEGGDPGFFFF